MFCTPVLVIRETLLGDLTVGSDICLMFSSFSNFLTEAPGQYTGPGVGGLVRQGPGQNIHSQAWPAQQNNQTRTSKLISQSYHYRHIFLS